MDRESVTVSARVFGAVVLAGERAGVDVPAILGRLGIDRGALGDTDVRLSLQLEDELWSAMATAADDPCFGLRAVEALDLGSWDVFGYALRTSGTLRGAIEVAARFNRLLHDVAELSIVDEGELVRVTHRFRGDPRGACRQAADYTMASLVVVARHLTNAEIDPAHVCFMHAAPAELDAYRDVFGARTPITFDAEHNEVAFHRSTTERPVAGGDVGLHAVLVRHAEVLLAKLPRERDLSARVREHLATELRGGEPTIATVAKRLATSERSLQRKLSEAGLSFREILDDMRRELGFSYLGDDRLAITDVAYLLGFSEPRAFHRAFKRWTGETPSEWRARGGSGVS